jgi:2-hydroxychromene-2-carboxylate isomerase
MWRDMERVCQAEMLPFRRPSQFPRRSLLALRIALVGARQGWIADFSRGVYAANFGQDKDIGDPAVLAQIVKQVGGDPVTDFHRADSDEIKAELRANGEEAEAKGLFGAPSLVCLQPTSFSGATTAWSRRSPGRRGDEHSYKSSSGIAKREPEDPASGTPRAAGSSDKPAAFRG